MFNHPPPPLCRPWQSERIGLQCNVPHRLLSVTTSPCRRHTTSPLMARILPRSCSHATPMSSLGSAQRTWIPQAWLSTRLRQHGLKLL